MLEGPSNEMRTALIQCPLLKIIHVENSYLLPETGEKARSYSAHSGIQEETTSLPLGQEKGALAASTDTGAPALLPVLVSVVKFRRKETGGRRTE